MFAAQTIAGEDSLLTTLLGFALLAVSVAVLAALHVRRWRRRGFPPSLRRLVHRTRTRRLSSPASPAMSGAHAPTAPEAANASPAESSPSPQTSPPTAGPTAPSHASPAAITGSASASSGATIAPRPTARRSEARYSRETLRPLAREVDHTRRLFVAEDRVGKMLAALPRERWFVERYVLIQGHRVPFLILGETGVFALWALAGRPQWQDPAFVNRVVTDIKSYLADYTGPVRAGICRAFAPAVEPRWWCRPGEPGAWVMGLNWVIPWLQHFGPDHGLSVKDVERFNALAGPHWDQPVARGVPAIPDID
jgi:hypothetical protein